MNAQELARVIDHTLLKPEASAAAVEELCSQAKEYNFIAVCVNPSHVSFSVTALAGTQTVVATVAGFPLGATTSNAKAFEARQAVEQGAKEVDMVINLGALITGEINQVTDDIRAVAEATHATASSNILKVILETAALTPEQIAAGCTCCVEAGADFVKTSTGFHPSGGATIEAVRLLAKHAPGLGVKAAGGIRDKETALAMLEAGATRLGMSAGIAVMKALA